MYDVAASLAPALGQAQSRLESATGAVARAGAHGTVSGAAMAQVAQAEIFTEALLAAVRGRLGEIKTAARS